MKHSIYIHQNKLNDKIYVGYSSNIKRRWISKAALLVNKTWKIIGGKRVWMERE